MKRTLRKIVALILVIALTTTTTQAGVIGDIVVGDDPLGANPVVDAAADEVFEKTGDVVGNIGRSITTPVPGSTNPAIGKTRQIFGGAVRGVGGAIKVGGVGISVINVADDTKKFIQEPTSHVDPEAQAIDAALQTANIALGAVAATAAIVGVVVLLAPEIAIGGAIAGIVTVASTTAFAVTSLTVAVAKDIWHGPVGRGLMDLEKGRARLGFAPLEMNEGLSEGRKIIKEELGFDPYDKSDMTMGGNVNVKKPNIYLYDTVDGTVTVTLEHADWITVSEPLYDGGWVAEIHDGSLNGTEDFLFYEASVPQSVLEAQEGFLLPAGEHQAALSAMLDRYGYSAKEKADFTEYWLAAMDETVTYICYEQDTERCEAIMALHLSRPADRLYRYWYWFVPYEEGQTVTEPEVIPIERSGFTVVEWGGVLE